MKRALCYLLVASLASSLSGCKTGKEEEEEKPPVKTMRDQSADISFQAFSGMLVKAIQLRDKAKLATMMAPDFGYYLPDGEGINGAFLYWDKENLWPQLEATVRGGFGPAGAYMVAPLDFALKGPEYTGFRLGIRREAGSWRFVYFVGN